jgi:glycosyltransferase involved in cell wall biosynthesis/O-antigen/teichoic acid export membrane protein
VHILVLTDREWTHPQGGGTGTNLFGQISRWIAWGHRVTVVASSYPGAEPVERIGALTIHRMGGRSTVFPRVIWKQWRGLVADADVVLEVVNGITFLSPIWLRTPSLTLIHHIHREHYGQEMGRFGQIAAFFLETAPLRWLYTHSRFLTLSHAEAARIAEHGIPLERIDVNYIGVEQDAFEPGDRSPEPTILYLGRLKRYKRIELLLDALEAIPSSMLEIAGEGDHRDELVAEIERRGLSDRVRLHGFVDEETKLRLMQRAWVNLTASSAEGWCQSVLESAACGTPTAALAVGGLPESVVDGRTGLLANDPDELAAQTQRLVEDGELRERLGRAALERSREFTWDRTARRTLDLLDEVREEAADAQSLRERVTASDTGRAAGLAGAVIAGNVIALVFTVAFARLLGTSGYGTLGALISTFIILQVPGSALQISVAREVSRAIAAGDPNPGAGVVRLLRQLLGFAVAITAIGFLARDWIAAAIGVDVEWAAAATLPTGCLWLLLSVERGALQGFQRYRTVALSLVGEGAARLVFGLSFYTIGAGVTGAFLGSAASIATVALAIAFPLREELARAAGALGAPAHWVRDMVARTWAPATGLLLLFILQEIHVIVVKHQASDDAAGSWAAAAVAAKAIIWVAIGLGLYLLPEAARRSRQGEDARPVLIRTLVLIALVAVPMVLVYAVAAKPLLSTVFGPEFTDAAGALPWLGLAMALLACAYLSVQYLLALGHSRFLWLLGVAALVEPVLVVGIGAHLTEVALALLAVQAVLAACVIAVSMRSRYAIGEPPPLPA